MGDPELVMIDEPTEGLAPLIVKQVGDLISYLQARRCHSAGRAEAFHRDADFASRLRDGAWTYRVRRIARGTEGKFKSSSGLA